MKTEFILRIEIGNDATRGDANLADEDNRRYRVRDVNGIVVGHYGRYASEEEA